MIILKEEMEKCAINIVEGMNFKTNEAVLIRGGTHSQELLEEIAINCYKKNTHPLIVSASDNFSERVYVEIPVETFKVTPKHYLALVKACDALINIEPFKDPAIQLRFPREKLEARAEASVPIKKAVYGNGEKGKRWCYVGWPTEEAAKFFSIDSETLKELIIGGMMVPLKGLMRRCNAISEGLKNADTVHITDPQGSDFTIGVKGRRINEDDGFISDKDIEMNDLGNNLPAGEVFVGCEEERCEGTIYCPITIDRFNNKIIHDITLHYENGKLILEKIDADDKETIIQSFNQALEIDKKTEKEIRTLNVGELGIGCNPSIDKAIGYILTDEKVTGTVHVAFGDNYSFGGTSRSIMHWDFVTAPGITLEVKYIDGSTKIIIQDGKILSLE
ncbi:MAG: aminopeptidase [Candidatus Wukongarchaeota archaeon]|nr:aminopeptidase [Candidatus Wukongarchaeota archaeon]